MVALLAAVAEHGEVVLSELAVELGASTATIRRDVAVLAEQGLLVRTHGGARRTNHGDELPVKLRDGRNRRAKQAIAQAAVDQLPHGRHAVALTGGTTTTEVLRAMGERHDLTIITNSVSLAIEAAACGQLRVLIAGGILRANSLELVGSLTESTFKQFNVGTAIVGSDGVSLEGGLTTHDHVEAGTNHTMIERAQRVICVADGTKIGRVTLAKLADLTDIDLLITDSTADPAALARIRRSGVEVQVVHVDHQ
ncbi:DeoR/GlpR family DNA-binding transcription regulator [Aestuariimicrobium ganziense]|uniref:DeoR/GlpR family DNA-binding transcription regulator n=1 Tax=Aestuariimicrobium ganziense TaxID=2773677 RepID=UPI0019435ADE|nr:DeoR/GlpR family DNA-binding transcription regulator [Aestuariimicrobium ganziense]